MVKSPPVKLSEGIRALSPDVSPHRFLLVLKKHVNPPPHGLTYHEGEIFLTVLVYTLI